VSLVKIKGWTKKGKDLFQKLPATTQASLRDAMNRPHVRKMYAPKSVFDLTMRALEAYSDWQAQGKDGSWTEFKTWTGLSNLQLDQIALAAVELGWDPDKSRWL